jgi:hypothetical protein
MPESWVKTDSGSCIVLREYDSTELAVRPGEEVVGDLTESGWAWVLDKHGHWGWVPLDCLEAVSGGEGTA